MAKSLPMGASALIASDLTVKIVPRFISRFYGTRAQLEAEGLIPPGFKWPHRRETEYWNVGQFRYWVQRHRPAGLKGPVSVWQDGDYWVLDISPVKGRADHTIYARTQALTEAIYSRSPAGARQFSAWWKAKQDDSYMAFRAQLLGDMAPRKRGRPAKTIVNTTEVTGGLHA